MTITLKVSENTKEKMIRPVRKLKISNFKIVYTTDKCHV